MIPDILTGTEEFSRAAGLGIPTVPALPDQSLRKLRRKLLREEVKEYFDAEDERNIVEIGDGLLDIIVIAWGSLIHYFGIECAREMAQEVVQSNLSKIVDGKIIRREDGKVLKPEGWGPPDLKSIIQRYQA